MMSRKSPFAEEAPTKPKTKREKAEAPTVPPPARAPKRSTVRPKQRQSIPAATVDEVVADLKNDPRREEE